MTAWNRPSALRVNPSSRQRDRTLFFSLGEFGAGASLDEQRHEVPDPTLSQLRVGPLDDRADPLGWNVCVLTG